MNLKITEEKALVTFDSEFSISELKEVKEIIKEIEEKNIVKIMKSNIRKTWTKS